MNMKKTLLTILALMTVVIGANAQTVSSNAQKLSTKGAFIGMETTYRGLKTPEAGKVKPFAQPVAPQQKISLDTDERIIGYFKSEEISQNVGQTPQIGAGTHTIGTPFYSNLYGKAVGGQLTKARIQLAEPIGSTTVSVYTIDAEGRISVQPATTGTIASTVAGWNDVTFARPVTLNANEGFFVTYTFALDNNTATHNFLVDYGLNTDYAAGGIYLLGDYGQGFGLYTIYSDVNLCIQLVVKGGSYSDDDIVLTGGIDRTISKSGENKDITMTLMNEGNNVPSSYTLSFQVDGKEVGSVNTPVDLSDGSIHSYTYSLPLASDLSKGEHSISVSVASINGKVPTVNTEDDKIDENIYIYTDDDVVAKQKTLVEQFTSSGCPNCPYGYDLLNLLNTKRDDLAWVSLHTDYGTVEDEYTTNFSNNLTNFEVYVFPSASFNRTYISEPTLNEYGTLAVGIGFYPSYYEQVANMFSNIIDEINTDVPAFASVNIASEYDETTRELKITVSGEGKADVQTILKDGALTVFLTEDGLKGLQYNNQIGGQPEYDYPHDHVLRYAADGRYGFGEPINWTSGTTYSNEYTITLDEGWNADNMNIVAFIGRPIQLQIVGEQAYLASGINDAWVSNTETVKLGETSTGIDNAITVTDENATEVARYSLDGTLLSAPTKGVNIVKMSDGTTRKVIVK